MYRHINFLQSPYITIIYIFCFLILGINYVVSNQSFFDLFVNFFNLKNRDIKDSSPLNKIINSPSHAQPFRLRPKGIASDGPLEGFSELLDLSATGTRQ